MKNFLIVHLELVLNTLKFRGFRFMLRYLGNALRIRLLPRTGGGVAQVFGHQFYYQNKGSITHLFIEMFGHNAYYFVTKSAKPVIIDIGANVGDSLLYFKQLYPESKIYAFEPNPQALALLRKNVGVNKFNDVEIFDHALGTQEGEIELFDDASGMAVLSTTSREFLDQTIGFIPDSKGLVSYQVPTRQLSNMPFFKELAQVDLLKMDIEGGELEVIEDVEPHLHKVRQVIMEFHMMPDPKNNSFDTLVGILRRNNFTVNVMQMYRDENNISNDVIFLINAIKK